MNHDEYRTRGMDSLSSSHPLLKHLILVEYFKSLLRESLKNRNSVREKYRVEEWRRAEERAESYDKNQNKRMAAVIRPGAADRMKQMKENSG